MEHLVDSRPAESIINRRYLIEFARGLALDVISKRRIWWLCKPVIIAANHGMNTERPIVFLGR